MKKDYWYIIAGVVVLYYLYSQGYFTSSTSTAS
jgi:hypothetical protein